MNTNSPMSNMPPMGPPIHGAGPAGAGKFKPVDPIRLIRAKWLWLVIAFLIGGGLGFGAWFVLNRELPRYTSEAQYDVQASNIDISSGRSFGPMSMNDLEPLIMREVQAAMAEPTLREVLNAQSVQQLSWFKQFDGDFNAAYEDLDENVLRARAIRETPLFVISATTKNEADAQIILEAHRTEFLRRKAEQIERDSSRDLQAAQRSRDLAEQRITATRGAITRFLNANPLEDLRGQSDSLTLRVRDLTPRVSELSNQLSAIQASYEQLLERQAQNDFDPSSEELQIIESRPAILDIDRQKLQIELAREPMLSKFGTEHEAVKALDAQLLELERQRTRKIDELARVEFSRKLEDAALNLQIVREALNESTQELTELRIQRQEFTRLVQEYENLRSDQEQAVADRVEAERTISRLREAEQNESRVLVRVAVPPQQAKQTFPPHPATLIAAGALMLTGLTLGLFFLREVTDQRVSSAEDVKLVPDAKLLGMIPAAGEDPGKARTIERVVEQHPSGLLAESYRQVRSAVLSKVDRRGYKTLMFVSAKPGAGVTTATQNFAASCALSGRRVLMIDANFRRPALASLMQTQDAPGLADLLRGHIALDQVGELTQSSDTENLDLLPAGDCATAAGELFENPRFRELLAKLETEYDLLLIDAPPALLTSDAQLLSRHVDAMVLVTKARTDTRGILQRLYRELDGQRADVLGVVLNGVQASAGGYLKENFREFHDYAGPERRKAPRTKTRSSNGSAPRAAAAPVAMQDDPSDAFGGFDEDESER